MKRFRWYTLVQNTFITMLISEKGKELQFRSISMLMLTKVVELKTFHRKWKSQRVLIAF